MGSEAVTYKEPAKFPTASLVGVRVHAVTRQQLLAFVEDVLTRDERAKLGYANVHALNLAGDDPGFRDYMNTADLVFCDGYGVLLGSWLTGQDVVSRNTPPDWIDELCARCAQSGRSLYFLGAAEGVCERAAAVLTSRHPGLRIAGTHHGYFDKKLGSIDSESVVECINRAAPDILVVGFGMPAQERWIAENWPRLAVHIAIPVGAMFDYVTGGIRRGPRWMTDNGLEWLARLFVEPRRLWRRYLVGNVRFLWRLVVQRLRGPVPS